MKKVIVDENLKGLRLDIALSKIENLSRKQVQDLIKEGKVYVNNKKTKPSYKLKLNDEILYTLPLPETLSLKPKKGNLDILYEDEDILVLNKPFGLVVHPAPGHVEDTLLNYLLYHFEKQGLTLENFLKEFSSKEEFDKEELKKANISSILRPGIVHRLDKNTAGILVIAKNKESHQKLSQIFQEKKAKKKYIAICQGVIPKDFKKVLRYKNNEYKIIFKNGLGEIALPIGREDNNRLKFSYKSSNPKEAKTIVKVLRTYPKSDVSIVECDLITGRTHQIRTHLASLGFPILNDELYGFKLSKIENKKLKEILKKYKDKMHALCAYKLEIPHPRTGEILKFEIDLPKEMKEILEVLN